MSRKRTWNRIFWYFVFFLLTLLLLAPAVYKQLLNYIKNFHNDLHLLKRVLFCGKFGFTCVFRFLFSRRELRWEIKKVLAAKMNSNEPCLEIPNRSSCETGKTEGKLSKLVRTSNSNYPMHEILVVLLSSAFFAYSHLIEWAVPQPWGETVWLGGDKSREVVGGRWERRGAPSRKQAWTAPSINPYLCNSSSQAAVFKQRQVRAVFLRIKRGLN